jgi:uncharacterized protein
MEGSLLRFYVHEGARHGQRQVWQWLLEEANSLGVRGGSAFRAMAGFGRHHVLHARNFIELSGSVAIEVEFIVSDAEAEQLLQRVQAAGVRVFYARVAARFAILNPDAGDA